MVGKIVTTTRELYKAINRTFEQAGIVSGFPERLVHLDTREPLWVSIDAPSPSDSEVGAG